MTSRHALIVCVLLLAIFAGFSFSTISRTSPTYDEPLESLGGWIQARHGDYRIFFEDPPLTHYWASIPNGRDALQLDTNLSSWSKLGRTAISGFNLTLVTLFKTPANDPLRFVHHARALMVPLGVLLGLMIALWAWRLGGTKAAVISTAFFALDPNFIAHAAIVKSDVANALVSFALVYSLWRVGQRLTIWNGLTAAMLLAIGLNTKFSGVLLVFIAIGILSLRGLLSEPWQVGTRTLTARVQRIGVAVALLVVMGLTAYAGIWASYRFRYAASPNPELGISLKRLIDEAKATQVEALAQAGVPVADAEANWKPDLVIRTIEWLSAHHVLPEAWLSGVLFVHGHSAIRQSFLLDRINLTGWRWYFPLAFVFKTPVVTLLALAAAIAIGVMFAARRKLGGTENRWTVVCLAVPIVIYALAIFGSHLNIGYRHLFPLLPYVYLLIGVTGSAAAELRPKFAPIAIGFMVLALAAESLPAAPNFLAFFNAGVGGPERAVHLLGDSNLDWGQGLPALATWQKEHANEPLYLSYFGVAPPELYGIDYHGLPGNSALLKKPEPIPGPAIVALSATHLQGLYLSTEERQFIRPFRRIAPMAVVGDSIFLYRWPLEGMETPVAPAHE